MKLLSMRYLEELRESKTLAVDLHEVINIFLVAMNDWPDPTPTVEDFENAVYLFLGDEKIDNIKLKAYNSKLGLGQAWQAESLHELLNVFKYYEDGKLLKEIVKDVQTKIEKASWTG